MSKIKLIACDIGGTLITDDNIITEENIKAFEYAKSKGALITLATARMYSSTKYISNKIKSDYGVFCNGSHIMDIRNLMTLKKEVLKHFVAKKIIEYAKNKDIYVHLNEEFCETSDQLKFFSLKHTILNERYEKNLQSNIKIVNDLLEYTKDNNEIFKVILVSEKYLEQEIEDIKKMIEGENVFLTEYYKDLKETAINKVISYAEFGCSNKNKANGVLDLAQILNISKDEIMAIGDQDNDIEMMQNVRYSIGMKNSTENIKKIAKYITKNDNNNSGVAEAIYNFIK